MSTNLREKWSQEELKISLLYVYAWYLCLYFTKTTKLYNVSRQLIHKLHWGHSHSNRLEKRLLRTKNENIFKISSSCSSCDHDVLLEVPLPCSGRGGGCGGGWCGGCCCGGCGASESLSSASKIPIILYDLMAFVSEPGKKTSGLQFVGSACPFFTLILTL